MTLKNTSLDTSVVIVGAGPIGLELAVSLRRRNIPLEIFESGPIGNTMSWWAPQTRWFSSNDRISIAGVPLLTPDESKATREQYLMYLRSIAQQFSIDPHCYEKVVDVIDEPNDRKRVISETDGFTRETMCDSVVLAIGGTDFPRRLKIEGESLPHVDGYLREVHRYFGRRVLIIGGRNSAVEAALRLHHVGAEVSISYRGDRLPEDSIKYWLRPEINSLIELGKIKSYFGTIPIAITRSHVVLRENRDGGDSTVDVPCDDVLSLIGYEQDKSLFERLNIELFNDDTHRPMINETTMESSRRGIYVAGTAVAGTQNSRYKTFLENCHRHVDIIVSDLTGLADNKNRDVLFERTIATNPES